MGFLGYNKTPESLRLNDNTTVGKINRDIEIWKNIRGNKASTDEERKFCNEQIERLNTAKTKIIRVATKFRDKFYTYKTSSAQNNHLKTYEDNCIEFADFISNGFAKVSLSGLNDINNSLGLDLSKLIPSNSDLEAMNNDHPFLGDIGDGLKGLWMSKGALISTTAIIGGLLSNKVLKPLFLGLFNTDKDKLGLIIKLLGWAEMGSVAKFLFGAGLLGLAYFAGKKIFGPLIRRNMARNKMYKAFEEASSQEIETEDVQQIIKHDALLARAKESLKTKLESLGDSLTIFTIKDTVQQFIKQGENDKDVFHDISNGEWLKLQNDYLKSTTKTKTAEFERACNTAIDNAITFYTSNHTFQNINFLKLKEASYFKSSSEKLTENDLPASLSTKKLDFKTKILKAFEETVVPHEYENQIKSNPQITSNKLYESLQSLISDTLTSLIDVNSLKKILQQKVLAHEITRYKMSPEDYEFGKTVIDKTKSGEFDLLDEATVKKTLHDAQIPYVYNLNAYLSSENVKKALLNRDTLTQFSNLNERFYDALQSITGGNNSNQAQLIQDFRTSAKSFKNNGYRFLNTVAEKMESMIDSAFFIVSSNQSNSQTQIDLSQYQDDYGISLQGPQTTFSKIIDDSKKSLDTLDKFNKLVEEFENCTWPKYISEYVETIKSFGTDKPEFDKAKGLYDFYHKTFSPYHTKLKALIDLYKPSDFSSLSLKEIVDSFLEEHHLGINSLTIKMQNLENFKSKYEEIQNNPKFKYSEDILNLQGELPENGDDSQKENLQIFSQLLSSFNNVINRKNPNDVDQFLDQITNVIDLLKNQGNLDTVKTYLDIMKRQVDSIKKNTTYPHQIEDLEKIETVRSIYTQPSQEIDLQQIIEKRKGMIPFVKYTQGKNKDDDNFAFFVSDYNKMMYFILSNSQFGDEQKAAFSILTKPEIENYFRKYTTQLDSSYVGGNFENVAKAMVETLTAMLSHKKEEPGNETYPQTNIGQIQSTATKVSIDGFSMQTHAEFSKNTAQIAGFQENYSTLLDTVQTPSIALYVELGNNTPDLKDVVDNYNFILQQLQTRSDVHTTIKNLGLKNLGVASIKEFLKKLITNNADKYETQIKAMSEILAQAIELVIKNSRGLTDSDLLNLYRTQKTSQKDNFPGEASSISNVPNLDFEKQLEAINNVQPKQHVLDLEALHKENEDPNNITPIYESLEAVVHSIILSYSQNPKDTSLLSKIVDVESLFSNDKANLPKNIQSLLNLVGNIEQAIEQPNQPNQTENVEYINYFQKNYKRTIGGNTTINFQNDTSKNLDLSISKLQLQITAENAKKNNHLLFVECQTTGTFTLVQISEQSFFSCFAKEYNSILKFLNDYTSNKGKDSTENIFESLSTSLLGGIEKKYVDLFDKTKYPNFSNLATSMLDNLKALISNLEYKDSKIVAKQENSEASSLIQDYSQGLITTLLKNEKIINYIKFSQEVKSENFADLSSLLTNPVYSAEIGGEPLTTDGDSEEFFRTFGDSDEDFEVLVEPFEETDPAPPPPNPNKDGENGVIVEVDDNGKIKSDSNPQFKYATIDETNENKDISNFLNLYNKILATFESIVTGSVTNDNPNTLNDLIVCSAGLQYHPAIVKPKDEPSLLIRMCIKLANTLINYKNNKNSFTNYTSKLDSTDKISFGEGKAGQEIFDLESQELSNLANESCPIFLEIYSDTSKDELDVIHTYNICLNALINGNGTFEGTSFENITRDQMQQYLQNCIDCASKSGVTIINGITLDNIQNVFDEAVNLVNENEHSETGLRTDLRTALKSYLDKNELTLDFCLGGASKIPESSQLEETINTVSSNCSKYFISEEEFEKLESIDFEIFYIKDDKKLENFYALLQLLQEHPDEDSRKKIIKAFTEQVGTKNFSLKKTLFNKNSALQKFIEENLISANDYVITEIMKSIEKNENFWEPDTSLGDKILDEYLGFTPFTVDYPDSYDRDRNFNLIMAKMLSYRHAEKIEISDYYNLSNLIEIFRVKFYNDKDDYASVLYKKLTTVLEFFEKTTNGYKFVLPLDSEKFKNLEETYVSTDGFSIGSFKTSIGEKTVDYAHTTSGYFSSFEGEDIKDFETLYKATSDNKILKFDAIAEAKKPKIFIKPQDGNEKVVSAYNSIMQSLITGKFDEEHKPLLDYFATGSFTENENENKNENAVTIIKNYLSSIGNTALDNVILNPLAKIIQKTATLRKNNAKLDENLLKVMLYEKIYEDIDYLLKFSKPQSVDQTKQSTENSTSESQTENLKSHAYDMFIQEVKNATADFMKLDPDKREEKLDYLKNAIKALGKNIGDSPYKEIFGYYKELDTVLKSKTITQDTNLGKQNDNSNDKDVVFLYYVQGLMKKAIEAMYTIPKEKESELDKFLKSKDKTACEEFLKDPKNLEDLLKDLDLTKKDEPDEPDIPDEKTINQNINDYLSKLAALKVLTGGSYSKVTFTLDELNSVCLFLPKAVDDEQINGKIEFSCKLNPQTLEIELEHRFSNDWSFSLDQKEINEIINQKLKNLQNTSGGPAHS